MAQDLTPNAAQGQSLYVDVEGKVQRAVVVNGQVLGSYGLTGDKATASFDYNWQAINGSNLAVGRYTVRAGDTLRSIALLVYGDESQWFRLAEANGLSSDAGLVAGMVLATPANVADANNNVGTYKSYNEGKILGGNLPAVGPRGEPCGGNGQLISQIVTVVVAAVVTAYTWDPVDSWTLGSLAGPVVAAAAGATAGQVAAVGTGIQDQISWKAIALSAASAAIAAWMPSPVATTQVVDKVTQPFLPGLALKAMLGNAAAQGVGALLGMQERFDWRGVAAAAVGSVANVGMTEILGSATGAMNSFATAGLKGLVAGTVTSAVRGGRINLTQVAVDAFGNALGEGLGWASSDRNPSSVNYRNEMDRQSDAVQAWRESYFHVNGSDAQDEIARATRANSSAGYLAANDAVSEMAAVENSANRGRGGGLCFVRGTEVHTRNGLRPIETIRAGDFVAARHEHSRGSTEVHWSSVIETYQHTQKSVVHLLIQHSTGASETISATAEHRFFVNGSSWKKTADLEPGDRFDVLGGNYAVLVESRHAEGLHTVYNFAVDEDHTYFVGERGVWVHNDYQNVLGGTVTTRSTGLVVDLESERRDPTLDDQLGEEFKPTKGIALGYRDRNGPFYKIFHDGTVENMLPRRYVDPGDASVEIPGTVIRGNGGQDDGAIEESVKLQEINDQRVIAGAYDKFGETWDSVAKGNWKQAWFHFTYEASDEAKQAVYDRLFPKPTAEAERLNKMLGSPIGTAVSLATRIAGGSQRAQDIALDVGAFGENAAGGVVGVRTTGRARATQGPVASRPRLGGNDGGTGAKVEPHNGDPKSPEFIGPHPKPPTRFVSGVVVVDKHTGRVYTGTVDLQPTIDRISRGTPNSHRNDGSEFKNRPPGGGNGRPLLPVQPRDYYTEYVVPTPGVSGPGPQRIVTGKNGEMYYTPDHYDTFIPIRD
jgi:guanyl-specific ribonuclease Sa/LysM repeat protein